VLVTTRPSAVLPTIASRCVRFRFGLLRPDEVRKGLRALKPQAPEPDLAVALSGGRIGRAIALAEGPSLAALKESRTLILEALEALARGTPAGTFAVIAGASFRAVGREDWTDAIAVLESLLRDLTVLAVLADGGGAGVVNADLEDRLRPLAAALGSKAARSLATLDAVRSDLRLNVNGRLAAERILLEIAR
jgi:DNA polymerase-3 subunit delta'